MPEPRYFLLANHHGVTAGGNLEPLHEVGIAAIVDTVVENEIIGQEQRVTIGQFPSLKHPDTKADLPARILPGSRIIEASDWRVIEAIQRAGQYDEIEKPTRADVDKHVKALTDAVEEAGTHGPAPGETVEAPTGAVSLAEALARPVPQPEPAPEPEAPAEETTPTPEEA